ncbi:hypothetical protein D4R87_03190 [bacterium]|nr:MAG: hypothetical protein D4R87_03190 [bacterium]
MNNKIFFVVCLIIATGGGFFAGTKYTSNKNVASLSGGIRNFQNISQEERQQRIQEMGAGDFAGRGFANGQQTGASFTNGEIISKDDESVTIEARNFRQAENQTEGSKIIFFSDATEISKFAEGSSDDLQVGQSVSVSGKTNSDGSITAETIQLRPEIKTEDLEEN